MKTETFIRRRLIAAPAEVVFRWHAEPGALHRLIPPWEPVEVVDEGGGLRDGEEVELRVRVGPIPIRWVSRLSDCEPGRGFRDIQVEGPFARWEHEHRMVPAGASASWLEDRVTYALPFGVMGRLMGSDLVRHKLDKMFEYRHRVTVESLAAGRIRGRVDGEAP